jgi:hypothetical protein
LRSAKQLVVKTNHFVRFACFAPGLIRGLPAMIKSAFPEEIFSNLVDS